MGISEKKEKGAMREGGRQSKKSEEWRFRSTGNLARKPEYFTVINLVESINRYIIIDYNTDD